MTNEQHQTLQAILEASKFWGPSIFLPLSILWITNRHTRKMKSLEKETDLKFNSKEEIRQQEKIVYSSLSKILFDVQQLHVSLSGSCVDNECIKKSLERFDASIVKYHEEISNHLLYLNSSAINLIYKFYNQISELKIELRSLDDSKNFDLAYVSVYIKSQELADTVISIQELFVKERSDLKIEFNKARLEMLQYCCGEKPPADLVEKYTQLKENMAHRNIDVSEIQHRSARTTISNHG